MRAPLREVSDPLAPALFRYEYCDVRFWYPWHFHPEVEIKHVLSGGGTRVVGDSIEPFHSGDLCIVGSNTPHCWTSPVVSGRWVRARFAQFEPALFRSSPLADLLVQSQRGLHVSGPRLPEALARLDQLFAAKAESEQIARLGEFLDTVATISGRPLAVDSTAVAPNHPGSDLAVQVLRFVQANYAGPLSENALAQQFGLSPSAFSRFFSRAFRKGFARFLAELRVAHASDLLLREDDDVASIARRCGFGTVASLNRHFRRLKKQAPSEYRKQARFAHAGARAGQQQLVRCRDAADSGGGPAAMCR